MMKIFTSRQVREIDAYTIANEPIASIDLMERAAQQMFAWLARHYETSVPFTVFAGPGNNGGDALVLARMLASRHYPTEVYLVRISDRLSGDAAINLERLTRQGKAAIKELKEGQSPGEIPGKAVILDGIFGSGLKRPVEGWVAGVIRHINGLPNEKISIDIPSGLFGEDNSGNQPDNIVRAGTTLSLQFPSLSFFFPENEMYAGRVEVIPIGLHPGAVENTPTDRYLLTREVAAGLLRPRARFSHKGNYGHALLVAGSYGMMGAAVLGAEACMRSGAGLLTVHVPGRGCSVIQTAVPEAIADVDRSDDVFTGHPSLAPFTAIGAGPGTGRSKETAQALHALISETEVPLLIDADGINILSEHKEWLKELPAGTILTPHPGEFARLAGKSPTGFARNEQQIAFSKKYKLCVVLKGAHTSVSLPDGSCYYNTTGNPGMATAGSGDVLTGIVLSLLAQGYSTGDAALLGVYVHGLAGDLAAGEGSREALIAGDITRHLGAAFRQIGGSQNPKSQIQCHP